MTATAENLASWTKVADYGNYSDAERAVDSLSDAKFPVENLTIVGCDLRMVERVLRRLWWGRAALSGLATGAWVGLLIGLLFSIFAVTTSGALTLLLGGVFWGALFGLVFALVGYALTRGRRDFVSRSATVAGRYELWASPEAAEQARATLTFTR